jgi:hypothetical protein
MVSGTSIARVSMSGVTAGIHSGAALSVALMMIFYHGLGALTCPIFTRLFFF